MTATFQSTIRRGGVWNDTHGKPIQAHGGVMCHQRLCYWYGEIKDVPNMPGEFSDRGELRIPRRDEWNVEMLTKGSP